MLTVTPVTDRADWDAFHRVPHLVYRDDPAWLPDGDQEVEALLSMPPGRAGIQAYVARDGGTPVGRIAAIEDHRYNGFHGERSAFFGFFEAVPAQDVATGLLNTAAGWARARGLTRLYGPVNPSMAHSAGLLVTGFGRPALVGMPYNPDYYPGQFDAWGLTKAKDLHSYDMPIPRPRYPSQQRDPNRWQPPTGVTFRGLDPDRFADEIEAVRQIYNAAFVDFWGHAPVDEDEFQALAEAYRAVLDPELVVFAQAGPRPIGYLMAIPDGAVAGHARVDMLAVHPDYQHTVIGGVLIVEMLRRIRRKGFTSAEAAPILEDAAWPQSIRRALTLSRVYRVYGRELV